MARHVVIKYGENRCAIDELQIGQRCRAIDPAKVKALAESIKEIGLKTPITVRMAQTTDPFGDGHDYELYHLVAGLHRVEAYKALGLEDIPCICIEGDEIDAQIWEIDENLIRAELTPAQIADHMARRKQLWLQKGGTTCPTLGGEQEIGFARDVADRTGQSKRDVNRAVSRGEKIAPDVLKLVQGTKLDTGAALDSLAKLPVDQQRHAAAAGKLPPAPLNDFEAINKQVAALMSAWNKAGPEAREKFLEQIDKPIMDRRFAAA